MDNYNERLQENLLEALEQKQRADKRLLTSEIFIGLLVTAIFLSLTVIAAYVPMADWMRIVLIIIGLIPFIIGVAYAIKIEQVAGYYECSNCGHRYVPKYSSVLWAPHVNRTRHMRCPECNKRAWHKKVLTKEKTK